uniref:Uncharacterized protein n=1 Tax=Anguilla anguilla TaxID=7936 RepID=A0A0E9SD98_ANGAN
MLLKMESGTNKSTEGASLEWELVLKILFV